MAAQCKTHPGPNFKLAGLLACKSFIPSVDHPPNRTIKVFGWPCFVEWVGYSVRAHSLYHGFCTQLSWSTSVHSGVP
eukprot:2412131-Amphidinium_carterae.1